MLKNIRHPPPRKNTPQEISSRSFMSSVGAGVYSGISHGATRSVGNLMRQQGQQQGYGWLAVEAQAQIVMFALLLTLKKVAEQQDAVSAAIEALWFIS